MKHARRLLPLLLILCFVVTFTTTAVFADSGNTSPPPSEVAPATSEAAAEPPETEAETADATGESSPPESIDAEGSAAIENEAAEEEAPAPTEEQPTEPGTDPAPSDGEIAKRDVIDKPWEITRPDVINANYTFSNGVRAVTLTYLSKDGVTKVCYCIEPGVPITNAGVNAGFTSNEEIAAWKNLSKTQQRAIALILAYGYPTVSFNDISTSGVAQKYGATQLLIWEIIDGVRDPNTFRATDMYCNYFSQSTYPTLYSVYNKIQADLLRHNCYPSFATYVYSLIDNYTYDLSYDAASGKYVCILKDTTTDTRYQTLPDYNFVSNIEGLTITRTDNVTLHIECTPEVAVTLPKELTFSAIGKAVTADCDTTITVWEAAGTSDQKLVSSSGARDPVPVYFRLKVSAAGTMTMQKTSSCGAVEGYRFKIWHKETGKLWYGKSDAQGAIYQTDENGNSISLGYTFEGLADGTYFVRELLSVAPDKTVFPDSWKITVTDASGNTTYDHTFTKEDLSQTAEGDCVTPYFTVTGLTGGGKMTMQINNAPTFSSLQIIKQSSDGKVSNISFNIYKGDTDYEARKIWQTVKTGKDGTLQIDVLDAGIYWVEEIIPEGYALQEPQRVEVTTENTKDNPAVVRFYNRLVLSLKIIKESPDGNVGGIPFNIYKGQSAYNNGVIWKTVVTDDNGVILINDVEASAYLIEEIVPDGYQKQAVQTVLVTKDNTASNPAIVTFVNKLLTSLKIVKDSPDGNVAGISFNIYQGKTIASGTLVHTAQTDDNGIIQIYDLKTGIYWIEEIVPDGYAPQEPQRITVGTTNTVNNPATVTFVNTPMRGSISVNKVDTADQPLSGATFLLEYSTDGGTTWAAVHPATEEDKGYGTCSSVTAGGEITTGEDGKAIFEGLLVSGVQYRLTETVAPVGYQLLAEPVAITEITEDENKNYAVYLKVVNLSTFQIPPSGADGNIGFLVSIASIVSITSLFGIFMLQRKRNHAKKPQ